MKFCNPLFAGASRGIPNELARRNHRAFRIEPHLVPDTNDAVAAYESHCSGRLTRECVFGSDLLAGFPDRLAERTRRMSQSLPSTETVFGEVVNGNHDTYLLAIHTMIDATVALAP